MQKTHTASSIARSNVSRLPIAAIATLAFGVLVAGGLSGCSLYVNIPGQPGDVARNDPNLLEVGQIQEAALRYMLATRPIEGPVQIILPEGTIPEVYNAMMPRISDMATWSGQDANANMPTLHVRRVLIRTPRGEVDVLRPTDPYDQGSPNELTTVYLKWAAFSGWSIERTRTWRIDPTTDPAMRGR